MLRVKNILKHIANIYYYYIIHDSRKLTSVWNNAQIFLISLQIHINRPQNNKQLEKSIMLI